jgi:hypothetical protein
MILQFFMQGKVQELIGIFYDPEAIPFTGFHQVPHNHFHLVYFHGLYFAGN